MSSGAVRGASRSRCCHWGRRQGWTLLGLLEQSEELGLPPVRGEEALGDFKERSDMSKLPLKLVLLGTM